MAIVAFFALCRSRTFLLVILLLLCTRKDGKMQSNAEVRELTSERFLMVPHKNSRHPSRTGPQGSRIRTKNEPRYQKSHDVITTSSVVECPNGFSRIRGKCIRLISSPVKLDCPDGWTFDNDICIGYEETQIQVRCDEGYTPEFGECTKTHEAPKEMSCPPDYEIVQDSCLKTTRVPADMFCPPGLQFIDSRCKGHVTREVILQCPPDFSMMGGKCIKEVIVPGKLTCATGSSFDGTFCVRIHEKNVLHGCQKGFIKKGNMCVKHSILKADRTCVHKHSKKCEEEHLACPAGCTVSAKAGVCECIDAVPPEQGCPKDYHLRADSKACVNKRNEPASLYCPQGTYPFHGQCKNVEKGEVKKVCPPGHAVGLDGLCHSQLEHEPTPKCSPELVLEFYGGKPVCIGQRKTSSQSKCPNGFSLWKDRCIYKDKKPLRYLCPIGFDLMADTKCVKRVEQYALVMCPVGFTHQFGSCTKELIGEAVGLCPPGFAYDQQTEECFKLFTSYDFFNGVKEAALKQRERQRNSNETLTLDFSSTVETIDLQTGEMERIPPNTSTPLPPAAIPNLL